MHLGPKKIRFIKAREKFNLSFFAKKTNCIHLKVVMAFHIKQMNNALDNIKTWNRFKSCQNQTRVTLVFYVVYFESDLTDLCTKLPQSIDCFCKISITLHRYDAQGEDDYVIGSRLMFESMLMKAYESFRNTSFVFYMEPDIRPIRSNWLTSISQEIGTGQFWLKGSVYRDDINKFAKNDPYYPNYIHINGNAIYNIGNTDLILFYFNTLRPHIVETNGDSINAYDTNFFVSLASLKIYGNLGTLERA